MSDFGERQGDDTGDEYKPGPDPIAVEFSTPDDPEDDPNEDVNTLEDAQHAGEEP